VSAAGGEGARGEGGSSLNFCSRSAGPSDYNEAAARRSCDPARSRERAITTSKPKKKWGEPGIVISAPVVG
jgi:hypothetical protein